MQWLQQPIYGGSYVPLQERGVVDLWKIFLNKEWYERCVEAYNLAAVIDKAKIHEVAAPGEGPSTVDRGGRGWFIRGYYYMEESNVGTDLHGDTGVIGFWYSCCMNFFNICVFDTDAVSYDGRHIHKIRLP